MRLLSLAYKLPSGILCPLLLSLLMLCGCEESIRSRQLQEFSCRLDAPGLSINEASAIRDALDSISPATLNEAEQNFRAFLSIKAADKAFIIHTDDSLYLTVKDYFASHHKSLYPEVLYYGGRVYSEIGDYPGALRYFTEALDRTDKNDEKLPLRGKIFCQLGGLLNSLRLYEPAFNYVNEAIKIDSVLKDTVSLVDDLQLCAAIANKQNKYGEAYRYSRRASELNGGLDSVFTIINDMNLARTSYKMGNLKEALDYIRKLPMEVDSLDRNEAYIIAAHIYLAAGIKDTAIMMAKKIINSNASLNRHNAFHILLSDSLQCGIEPDTLRQYLRHYHNALERYYDANTNEAALMQHTLYNYAIQERIRRQTEEKNQTLVYIIGGLLLGFSFILILLLWIKYRQQKEINELKEQLNGIEKLKSRIEPEYAPELRVSNIRKEEDAIEKKKEEGRSFQIVNSDNIENASALREKLQKELRSLAKISMQEPYQVDKRIIESEPYKTIKIKIEADQPIPDVDPVWERLERVLLEIHPTFIDNLRLLIGHRITKTDIHTALMVKSGFRPVEMGVAFCVSKGAIVSRRENLALKIFGERLPTKEVDSIIRKL